MQTDLKTPPSKLTNATKPKDALSAPAEGLSREDAFTLMEQAPATSLESLNNTYFKSEPGVITVMEYVGMDEFNGDDGPVDAIIMLDKSGNRFICASKLVVDACRKLEPNTYIRLTNRGKKDSGKNRYDDYNVEVFPRQRK